MKKILIFGAGRSAWYTIDYLLKHAASFNAEVVIADASPHNIAAVTADFPQAATTLVNVNNEPARQALIKDFNIVISLLPAQFHILVAQDCLEFGAHLITPSYITDELKTLGPAIEQKGLLFINELGLDPGIDHMSAMEVIHRLKDEGKQIKSFRSYCGGLIAKEDDNNPWHYKFTWNPYNVVRAGQDGGLALRHGKYKYLPYNRLFLEATAISSPKGEVFDAYINRNSLPYISYYELDGITDFERGTLRYAGFCRKWQYLVNAGLTQDKIKLKHEPWMAWDDYLSFFLPEERDGYIKRFESLQAHHLYKEDKRALEWLFENKQILLREATPAELLQHLLEDKWKMAADDRDRIVMIHELEYEDKGKNYLLKSFLDLTGDDAKRTAMAKTVGLPLALAARLIAEDKINATGVVLPTLPQIYVPVLGELHKLGINFIEEVREL